MTDKHDHVDKRAKLTNPLDILAFTFAGEAYFTLVGKEHRFTYNVVKSEDGRVFFVKVLTGSDNNSDYQYAGVVKTYGKAEPEAWDFKWTEKSMFKEDAPSVGAFKWFFTELQKAQRLVPHKLGQLTFWHEGRCGRCGHRLTVPESVERGIGPECARKVAV